jgi:uncharacterized membrane protein SpoIIM required for sporulation
VNKRRFVAARADSWRRFEQLLDRLDTISVRKFSAAETAEFSRLFRELCYDLSLIRSRDWGRGLVSYLNDLVSRGHNAFYSSPPGNLGHLLRFLGVGFPRVFRKNIWYFVTAAALFFGPLAVSWSLIQHDPSLAARIVDPRALKMYEEMYSDRESTDKNVVGKSKKGADEWGGPSDFGDQGAIKAGLYTQHNGSIALDCFARGILLGVGTVYTLIYNGIALGAISGYLIATGHSQRFLSFVVSHGSFELTAIAVAGGAGLMLGNALVHPGQRSRLEALRTRGLEAIQVAAGAAAMIAVAALIEAFWSPAAIPNLLKYSVGGVLWLVVLIYLSTAGRWEKTP